MAKHTLIADQFVKVKNLNNQVRFISLLRVLEIVEYDTYDLVYFLGGKTHKYVTGTKYRIEKARQKYQDYLNLKSHRHVVDPVI